MREVSKTLTWTKEDDDCSLVAISFERVMKSLSINHRQQRLIQVSNCDFQLKNEK